VHHRCEVLTATHCNTPQRTATSIQREEVLRLERKHDQEQEEEEEARERVAR